MTRHKVSSTMIKTIGHNNNILEIEFINGSIYRYSNVPAEIYKQLKQAQSPGKYFIGNVKTKYKVIK